MPPTHGDKSSGSLHSREKMKEHILASVPEKLPMIFRIRATGRNFSMHGTTTFPKLSDCLAGLPALGFARKMGGGFDAVLGRAFAWRVLDV